MVLIIFVIIGKYDIFTVNRLALNNNYNLDKHFHWVIVQKDIVLLRVVITKIEIIRQLSVNL